MEEIMDTVIVIMLKNKETGFLEKEIGNYTIEENERFIVNAFAVEEESGIKVHLKLTVDKDVEDWEFDAIYDYYDEETVKTEALEVLEVEDCYNPTWEIVFDFIDSQEGMEEKLGKILECHRRELEDVYEAIKDKKEEYMEWKKEKRREKMVV